MAAYLAASFGDPQRLDYGTGHETNFLVFLYCLVRLGGVPDSAVADGSLALAAAGRYFKCCRLVQTEYGLEPAGSRGVWALDDYQCLAFLFGSAQHSGSPAKADYALPSGDLIPLSGPEEAESLFFDALRFAAASKSGASFARVCPVLFDLSHKTWRQINTHILSYYEREVLGNLVVARHLLFGTLFSASWRRSPR